MGIMQVNYYAVLVCGILMFMLGGLWYSPALFAKRWMQLIGKTEEELPAGNRKEIKQLLKKEMNEIFYGKNMQIKICWLMPRYR